jgi:hypothetical protein
MTGVRPAMPTAVPRTAIRLTNAPLKLNHFDAAA